MTRVYFYVVDRDFGFAPNPFHGICTLATCKARIRNTARPDDWIIGVGGSRLRAVGKCVYAMKVTEKITYNEYWTDPLYNDKKPVRNGSKIMMLGDNIYFKNPESNIWLQAHSHHSNQDGTVNAYNLGRDTKSIYVLISRHFYFFGITAPELPQTIMGEIGYKNGIDHRVYDLTDCKKLIDWLENNYKDKTNLVLGDPFDFCKSEAHYSYETNKVS